MNLSQMFKLLRNPNAALRAIFSIGALDFLPDSLYLRLLFPLRVGYPLNLTHPKTFNEKLQWLKLHDRKPEYKKYVDKYAVRDYVRETVGEQYLVPLLGVWDSVEEIDFVSLPNQFVLKTTHDSGGVVICKDKRTFDIPAAKKKLWRHLKTNLYKAGREWAYKGVPRKIIALQYLEDTNGQLDDFKIFCFGGKPKFIMVDFDRFTNLKRNLYSLDWEYLPFTFEEPTTHPEIEIPRPAQLEEMLRIASELSTGFAHIRVDLFTVGNAIFFGELTFYNDSGFARFHPENYDARVGEYLKLPFKESSK